MSLSKLGTYTMPFPPEHWRNPRSTIATKYEKDDIAYISHGCKVAMEAYRLLDTAPATTHGMTLLDVGCGTGRCARAISPLFEKVIAYDPIAECIELAKRECTEPFPNVEYTSDAETLPTVDCAMCINVIEHLSEGDAARLLSLMYSHVKKAGKIALWYSVTRNARVIGPLLTEDERHEDARLSESNCDINVRLFRV